MKIALWTFCLLVATPAFAGSFDVPVTSLEAKLNSWIDAPRDGAPQGLRPEAHATPQECSRKSGLSCSVVIFNVMIIASGTELPAKTTEVQLLLNYQAPDRDGRNVSTAIVTAMWAYDPSLLAKEDFQVKFRTLWEGVAKQTPSSIDGVEAHYSFKMVKVPWQPSEETPVLYITPR